MGAWMRERETEREKELEWLREEEGRETLSKQMSLNELRRKGKHKKGKQD